MTPAAADLFRQGVAAAKAGEHKRARDLLARVTAQEPDNAPAWLWLSGVTATLEDRLECLQRAGALEPDNPRIAQALAATRQSLVAQWIQKSAAAIEAGAPEQAQALLMRVVEIDEANVDAWWQLSQIVAAPGDREVCLDNVLTLDPDHAEARAALASARREQPPESTSPVGPVAGPEPVETLLPPPLIAPPAPSPTVEPTDPLHDPMSCPACAAATDFEDRFCPSCTYVLWTREREAEQRSTSYWTLIALEGAFILAGVLLPMLLLTYATMRLGLADPIQLVPVYLGSTEIPAGEASTLFGLVPRVLFWLSLVPSALSLLILFCVLTRWPPAFFVAASLGGLRIVTGIGGIALALSNRLEPPLDTAAASIVNPLNTFTQWMRTGIVAADGLVVLLSTIALILLLSLHDHFSFKSHRRLLRIDADVDGSDVGLWLRGREYAQQRVWARAALHLRASLGLEKRPETFLALAVAYRRLGWLPRAAGVLADARRLYPDEPQIADFARLLSQEHERGEVTNDTA